MADSLRYARQMALPEIGTQGQERLSSARAVVIGAGGLGSPALHHLVATGVGTVGVVEFDTLDITNLHRQTLYSSDDVGRDKLGAAVDRLRAINPDVRIVSHAQAFDADSSDQILSQYDIAIDGSDTFSTRYAASDASVRVGIPLVYASVGQFSGQASVFGWNGGPCYRCLFPEPPPEGLIPTCEGGGVLGVVPSIMGTIQAAEALKVILGIGDPLSGRLMLFDALSMTAREVLFDRDHECAACGVGRKKKQNAITEAITEISSADARAALSSDTPPHLLDVREAAERNVDHIGGRHIPLGMLAARAFELDDLRDRPIVVYCASGGRSATAARLLSERGFDALSLRGGIQSWRASQPAS